MENGKIKSSVTQHIKYSLFAILFCIWLYDIRFFEACHNIGEYFANFFTKIICRDKKSYEYDKVDNNCTEQKKTINDIKDWFCATHAEQFFLSMTYLYTGFFSFALVALFLKICDKDMGIITGIAFITPALIMHILINRYVLSNDRYIPYFKQFMKKSQEWHKRWNLRTCLFVIGAYVLCALGIVCAYLIINYLPIH